MPPKEAIVFPSLEDDEDQHYSFAVEYTGPPVTYDLPRAVPINVEKIPVAAVVSKVPLHTELHIPVVPPILAPDRNKFSKELLLQPTVSPTSVIAFEERVSDDTNNCLLSGELSSYESGELVELINNDDTSSRRLAACSVSNEHSSKLDSCDSFDKSRGSSSQARISNDDDLNQPDWGSNESVLSLDYPSSRVSSLKTGDCNNESNGDVRRPQAVTFGDIESDDGLDEEFSQDQVQAQVVRVKREPQTKGKKGSCYRCFKGNRFTEKEVCIVCDAKYCSNCVLRAMGSMPEGRKCVTCIGFPIDESKRGVLGKFSRMLKRLLNDLEVRQIMKAEKLCEANQLPPEYIFVNGQPLCYEELAILQSCPNPPKKLKPGNYWYDKVFGLWGKEGQKPSNIISPHLNVGGLTSDVAVGRSSSCRQPTLLGYIWGKAGTKLVCAVLSLPVPSKSSNPCGESLNSVTSRSVPDYLEQRTLQKILLVGSSGSGSSIIFKQAKILYKDVPFSEDERESIKLTIQTNVYGYLGMLLEGRERFEEESLAEMWKRGSKDTEPEGSSDDADSKTIYSIGPRLKSFSDWLLKTMVSGNLEAIFPAATREYAPLVEELWKHTAIQETYNRRSELEMLPSVASYYLERVVEILKTDYEPSDLDILYAEGVTSSNGLACVDFSFPQSSPDENSGTADQHDSLLRYQLIRVQARGFGENCKWLEMFEDVGMVIFCVALSDYDQFSADGTNKMLLNKKFFETIVTHPSFDQMEFLLILNKFDMFEEKIERVPLTRCEWFDDFHPLISRHRTNTNSNNINNNPTLGQLAFHYVAVKFKRLYSSLTGRKLYVSHVKGLEPKSVDAALKLAREILKWDEERVNFSLMYILRRVNAQEKTFALTYLEAVRLCIKANFGIVLGVMILCFIRPPVRWEVDVLPITFIKIPGFLANLF
ncbi:hypothetical protein V6N11_076624 [Hibiscus sabdariffa]|uniref:Extra-large guanine nucleotide-binding protein 1 n=1 Tax=Hibiscus sabdariffa TaxID=183260 RepID=A0ABR2Q6V5_9ROSI